MNNILVINNKINYLDSYVIDNDLISINDNVITFKKDGNYNITYVDCSCFKLFINVNDNVYVKLFVYCCNQDIDSNIIYNLDDNANINVSKFYSNKLVNEKVIFNLNGYMSKVNYNFSNICKNSDKYDFVVNHNNSNSISNLYNKTVSFDLAKCDYKIDSIVGKGNINCVLNQDTKIVNLGDNNSSIKPNMFIEEDTVFARHASVVGNVGYDLVFYLLTRGICYTDAMKLIVKGYILSNLDVDMEKRSLILEAINDNWR